MGANWKMKFKKKWIARLHVLNEEMLDGSFRIGLTAEYLNENGEVFQQPIERCLAHALIQRAFNSTKQLMKEAGLQDNGENVTLDEFHHDQERR